MTSLTLVLITVCVAASADAVAAQPATTAAAVAAQAAQPSPPAPPADYIYTPEARRDPFVSLMNRGLDAHAVAAKGTRPDGLAGVTVEEATVRGIVQSRGGWVAIIASPAGRSYTIRPGDRLLDGSVRAINGQAVILMQEVNDPLSLERQREVHKFLRAEVK
jgi:Tfp pilus assembly protein PilP